MFKSFTKIILAAIPVKAQVGLVLAIAEALARCTKTDYDDKLVEGVKELL